MKKNLAVVGAQWGDEGKGKIVDQLARRFDAVARYQGGHNAGHTIHVGDRRHVLHLIPSGVLHPKVCAVIGTGVVLDPVALLEEWSALEDAGLEFRDRLFVSTRCHLILPYHRMMEAAVERQLGQSRIGTTCRGIGPAYEDKMARRGLRVCDLLDAEGLADKIHVQLAEKHRILATLGDTSSIDPESLCRSYVECGKRIRPIAVDTTILINQWIQEGRTLLFEGAQGTLLDIDHGTFPYVTSSSTAAGGVATGLGISPKHIDTVLGVTKAYATRVGLGPFPTEAGDQAGDQLRSAGNEFGATTGRARRCGWFDGPAGRYAALLNAFDSLAVTKIDVLDSLDEIPFCTAYRYKGSTLDEFPADCGVLERVEPVYRNLPGWKTSTHGIRDWNRLPAATQDYLRFLSDYLEVPIRMISTGTDRNDTIHLSED